MSSRRLILNTSATYARSVIAAGLALFSGRWLLAGLGPSDFGLYAIVGSIILFITFLNGVMAGSAARHFAFALGRGDSDEVNKWFNTSFSIHLLLPVVLISLGWPMGEYGIRHILTVPADRIASCLWVFRLSLVAAFSGMVSIPYFAMFSARQHLAELAVWGTLQSILLFAFAFILPGVTGDRLLFCAGYGVAISVGFHIIQVLRARALFAECRLNRDRWFDRRRFREILSFASWNLIGTLGGLLRDQGSAILLNLHFGPRVNAAYGIANNVSAQTSQLGVAMVGAFSPELTAREGRGDRVRMLALAQRASKFGSLLILLFAVPLMIEMDYILKLWLVEPPLHTGLFCQLILGSFVLDRLSAGYMLAINAQGKIAAYQATLGTCLLLTLPLAWVFLKLGGPPVSVGAALVVTTAAVSAGRVFWARRLLGVEVRNWLRGVALPTGAVALAALAVALVPRALLPPSFPRLALVTGAAVVTTGIMTWLLALDGEERETVRQGALRLGGFRASASRPAPAGEGLV